jgi:hypothetical protein
MSVQCLGAAASWSALVAIAGLLAACGLDDAPCPPRPTAVLEERSSAIPHRELSEDGPTTADIASPFVVQVTNNQPSIERVQVSLDGDTALDVDLPGAEDCWTGHPPIFSFDYDLPAGPVEVELTLQGDVSTSTVDVPAAETVWAVIDVQSERAWGDVTIYNSEPQWG